MEITPKSNIRLIIKRNNKRFFKLVKYLFDLKDKNSYNIVTMGKQELLDEKSANAEFFKTLTSIFDEEKKLAFTKKQCLPDFQHPSPENLPDYQFPPLVQIGITNVCNLQCKECYYPLYSKKPDFQPFFMKMKLFEKIINEVKNFPYSTIIRFLGKGESLMHPRFIEMIAYAKQHLPHRLACITNGTLLDQKTAKKLLKTNIDVVDISLDAFTAETYTRVRSSAELFPKLIQKVENLIKLRDQNQFKTKIMVSFLIQPENYHEVWDFKKYWQPKVDKILYRKYHTYGGKINKKPTPYAQRIPCAALWTRININEKGLITLCYVDWDDQYILADLNNPKVTILRTWQTAFNQPRKSHLEGKFEGLCKNCEGWQTAHWFLSYERAINLLEQND